MTTTKGSLNKKRRKVVTATLRFLYVMDKLEPNPIMTKIKYNIYLIYFQGNKRKQTNK